VRKKRRLKRIYGLSTILLALLILFVPKYTFANEIDDIIAKQNATSGTDGGIDWEISGDTLTLSAAVTPEEGYTSGIMKDYYQNEHSVKTPWAWSNASSNVTKIVVEDGVTELGKYGIYAADIRGYGSTIESITIAGTVKKIKTGSISVEHCYIKKLIFEEGVEELEKSAVIQFPHITGSNIPSHIKEVYFPKSVNIINKYAIIHGADNPWLLDTPEYMTMTDIAVDDVYGYKGTASEEYVKRINGCTIWDYEQRTYVTSRGSLEEIPNSSIPTRKLQFHDRDGNDPEPEIFFVMQDGLTDLEKSCIAPTVTKLTENLYFGRAYEFQQYGDVQYYNKGWLKPITDFLNIPPTDCDYFPLCAINITNVMDEKVDFGTCTINMPIPSSWDLNEGTVKIVHVDGHKYEEYTSRMVEINGIKCMEIKLDYVNRADYMDEFYLAYVPNNSSGGGETNYTLTVNDLRKNKENTGSLAATVSNLTENLNLYVRDKDSDGITTSNVLRGLVTIKTGERMEWYDISLKNEAGNDATGFGNCSIKLPIPSDMDLSKGKVQAVTVGTNGTLEKLNTNVTTENGVKIANFASTHFSEYGLLYTLNETDNGGSGNSGGGTGDSSGSSGTSGGGSSGNSGSGSGSNSGEGYSGRRGPSGRDTDWIDRTRRSEKDYYSPYSAKQTDNRNQPAVVSSGNNTNRVIMPQTGEGDGIIILIGLFLLFFGIKLPVKLKV